MPLRPVEFTNSVPPDFVGWLQELGWPAASVGPLGAGTVMLPYFGVALVYAAGSRAQQGAFVIVRARPEFGQKCDLFCVSNFESWMQSL